MEFHKYLSFMAIILFLFPNYDRVSSKEMEGKYSYKVGSKYGPDHWGDIHRDWATCSKGKMQSPIDLNDRRVQHLHYLGDLNRSYRSANAVIKNRGHDIMVKWEDDAGEIWINGTKFSLLQVHWHTPSEHTINNHKYAMELHMVHQRASDNKFAVVAILYTIGRPDTFLTQMMKYIKLVSDKREVEVKIGIVDPRNIKRGSRRYYRYIGSLTTPPCTEGVVWTVIRKVRTVSKEQLKLLKEAVEDGYEKNARPSQGIDGRVVQLYQPINRY
ncbi:alpha carbonic anhydrase 7-like [Phalaenopsis equestris]|uniref:alpha carbonic anhydrase 7-like n=1 Tax=Phalaenopsis equestris TaxID=78828 RepID=UPI0009E3D6EA|nr:alpha carbonic anhydrase 7-like [Phalaenopsis equestris]